MTYTSNIMGQIKSKDQFPDSYPEDLKEDLFEASENGDIVQIYRNGEMRFATIGVAVDGETPMFLLDATPTGPLMRNIPAIDVTV